MDENYCLSAPSVADQQSMQNILHKLMAEIPEADQDGDIFHKCPLIGGGYLSEAQLKKILYGLILGACAVSIVNSRYDIPSLLSNLLTCPDQGWLTWIYGSAAAFCPATREVVTNILSPDFLPKIKDALISIGSAGSSTSSEMVKYLKDKTMIVKMIFDFYYVFYSKKEKDTKNIAVSTVGIDNAKRNLLKAAEEFANACSACVVGQQQLIIEPSATISAAAMRHVSGPGQVSSDPGQVSSGPGPAGRLFKAMLNPFGRSGGGRRSTYRRKQTHRRKTRRHTRASV